MIFFNAVKPDSVSHNNPIGGSITGCCGSHFSYKDVPDGLSYSLMGINVFPSPVPIVDETDEYWTESIPVGNEFLVVRHRKAQEEDTRPYEEDEEDDEFSS